MSEVPFTYLMCGIEYNTESKMGSGYRIGYDFGPDVRFQRGNSSLYGSRQLQYITVSGEILPKPKIRYRSYYTQCD